MNVESEFAELAEANSVEDDDDEEDGEDDEEEDDGEDTTVTEVDMAKLLAAPAAFS